MFIKKYCVYGFYLLLFFLLVQQSCTYDYFGDEHNYVVYAPKADQGKITEDYRIEDIAIYIYNNDLQRERYSYTPFDENPRSLVGDFHFKLFPGSFDVYCFTGLTNLSFVELNTYSQARFDLKKNTDGYYLEPSAIYLEYTSPTIHFPGPVVTDTAHFDSPFTGRICIAFKNMSSLNPTLTSEKISYVDIEASGVGTTQYFSQIFDSVSTRSSRFSDGDKMLLTSQIYSNPYKDFDFGLENLYLPSPDLATPEPINLRLQFRSYQDEVLYTLFVTLIDNANSPVVLHANETLLVEIDGDKVHIVSLTDPAEWEGIKEGGGNNPGGGPGSGIEV